MINLTDIIVLYYVIKCILFQHMSVYPLRCYQFLQKLNNSFE